MGFFSGIDASKYSIDHVFVPRKGTSEYDKKVRISSLRCDSFLKDIPPVHLTLSEKSDGSLEGAIFSYKRSLLHEFSTGLESSKEKLEVLVSSLDSYKACIGLEPDTFGGQNWSELYDGLVVKRHPKCSIVIVDSDEQRCDFCCQNKKRRKISKKLADDVVQASISVKMKDLHCQQCEMEFRSKNLLQQHVRRKHFAR